MPYVKPPKNKENHCYGYDNYPDFDKKKWKKDQPECEQLPGTLLRVFIPAGAVINLLNLLELTTPSGICLIIRIPLLGGNNSVNFLLDSIKAAGGRIEVVHE